MLLCAFHSPTSVGVGWGEGQVLGHPARRRGELGGQSFGGVHHTHLAHHAPPSTHSLSVSTEGIPANFHLLYLILGEHIVFRPYRFQIILYMCKALPITEDESILIYLCPSLLLTYPRNAYFLLSWFGWRHF